MTATLTATELHTLVDVATRSVEYAVHIHHGWHPDPHEYPTSLQEPGAAFVTLRLDGRLRGCIGQLVAAEPLVNCVADRARAAALDDPRFPPVTAGELAFLEVEVSVLGKPERFDVADYDDLLRTVRPGVDGLVVEAGSHRATLLPAVWDDLPMPIEFVEALWRKAGLRPGDWPNGIRMSRYTAQLAHGT
ncbi:MAG: AmmeMemoRadiSam system protein A [Actinomycetota bacterium]